MQGVAAWHNRGVGRPLLLVLLLLGGAARAQVGPRGQGYEERLEQWGLRRFEVEREPAPEGKRIARVLVASEEVFSASDPFPEFLNVFHSRTREAVIERELLLDVGSAYSQERADESERNLRKLFILAVVRVLPVKLPGGELGLLVVTKDRWSLRLNSEFRFVGNLLQYLRLRPTEQNLFGRNQQLELDLVFRLDTLSVGQTFQDRRLLGGRLAFGETASLIFNRSSGALEGSSGQAVFGKPLLSLDTRWGFSTGAQWLVQRKRVFRGATVWQLPYDGLEPGSDSIPFIYDARSLSAEALVTRSLGHAFKTDVSVGAGAFSRSYVPPPESGLDSARAHWFVRNYLPRSESARYFTAQVKAYQARYQVMRDLDAFALSEDFQLGYSTLFQVRWAEPAWSSPTRFVELGATARYRLALLQDLASLTVAAAARYMPGSDEEGAPRGWVNKHLAVELLNYSPPFEGGRFVVRGLLDVSLADLDHRLLLLGGGNGLRGAPAELLSGRNLALMNLEYRTRPVELNTLYLGFVLFYDAGAAFNSDLGEVTHTAGIGARLLIPQFNQEVIRLDLGLVIGNGRMSADRFSGSFGQVNDLRPAFLDAPLN